MIFNHPLTILGATKRSNEEGMMQGCACMIKKQFLQVLGFLEARMSVQIGDFNKADQITINANKNKKN